MQRFPSPWRPYRDVVLFMLGLAGAVHELFFTTLDRPALLVLCAACMGLAVKLRNGGYGNGR